VNRILVWRVTLSVDQEGPMRTPLKVRSMPVDGLSRQSACRNGISARRWVLSGATLSLAMGALAACGPNPAGSGGLVGHMSGTSDVAGQPGDPAIGGGVLAIIPLAAMGGPFGEPADEDPVANPRAWSHLSVQLSQMEVARLGGKVATIDGDGDFRVKAPPGEYAVCYWPSPTGTRIWGCSAVELPTDGELKAFWGEAGFHVKVVN
jgi:hypothetical protein